MESEKNTELVWYKNVSYEEKIELAKEKLSNMVGSFVEAGYWIRSIWEDEECRKHGYATIWDMAEAEFGLKKSRHYHARSDARYIFAPRLSRISCTPALKPALK